VFLHLNNSVNTLLKGKLCVWQWAVWQSKSRERDRRRETGNRNWGKTNACCMVDKATVWKAGICEYSIENLNKATHVYLSEKSLIQGVDLFITMSDVKNWVLCSNYFFTPRDICVNNHERICVSVGKKFKWCDMKTNARMTYERKFAEQCNWESTLAFVILFKTSRININEFFFWPRLWF
jgi:hypothetical protein